MPRVPAEVNEWTLVLQLELGLKRRIKETTLLLTAALSDVLYTTLHDTRALS